MPSFFPSLSSAATRIGRAAALLLVLVAPASALASLKRPGSEAAPPRLRGDLNGDGSITSVDALAVLYQAVGKPLPAGFAATPYGDVNCDENVTALDALVILNRSVGRDVSRFCIGQVVLPPVRISAVPNRFNATAGDSVRFMATALDSAGNAVRPAELVWNSSDTTLATVDSSGLVRTRARGDVQITVAWASDPSVRTAVVLPIFTALPPTTEVIDSTKARLVSDSAALANGTYVFQLSGANPPTISPGDVIVGAQGNGFLRRVNSVEVAGSQVVAHTSDASLTDAIPEGSFSVRTRLPLGSAIRAGSLGTSVSNLSDPLCLNPLSVRGADSTHVEATPFGFDLSGTVLYQGSGITLTIPSGSITFDPDLDIGADWGLFKGVEFHAIASGALSLDADIQAVASRTGSYDRQTDRLAHVCRRFTVPVGSFVVTGRAELDLYALIHVGGSVVGTVKTGATSTASVQVGARYQDKHWSGVGEASLTNSAHPFTWTITGDANIRVTLKPVLTIYLYDVLGPSFATLPYAEAEAAITSTNWEWRYRLGYGVYFELGATARILNYDLGSWTYRITGPSGTIAKDSGFLAIDSLRITPGPVDTLDAYGLLDLTARAFVQDQVVDGPPTWSSSNPSVADVNAHGNVTALTQGTTYIRASALTKRDSVKLVVISRSTLSKDSGDGQTGVPGSILPDDVVVRARTQTGVGIPGVPVVFAVTGGGGQVSHATVNTDGSGYAAVRWMLGPAEGVQTLTASAHDLGLVTFTATSTTDTLPHVRSQPLVVSYLFVCALSTVNAAYCMGRNPGGQFGNGTTTDAASMTPVAGGLSFAAISAGYSHTCAITTDAESYCWGGGTEGELGNNSREQSLTPVPVSGFRRFVQLTSGVAHTCALDPDGQAFCWGDDRTSQLGVGSDLNPPPVPNAVATTLRFKQLAAGDSHTCGLTGDGSAYCWGAFDLGATGVDTATTYCYLTTGPIRCIYTPAPVATALKFTSIAAGYTRTCALTAEGATYCWGTNHGPLIGYNFGLGDGTTEDSKVPRRVAQGLTFSSIVVGARHTCALTPAGAAYCWGYNYSGQLGNGNNELYTLSPVPVVGGHVFTALAAGWTGTCGITATGALYCWGDTTLTNQANPVPTLVSGITVHQP